MIQPALRRTVAPNRLLGIDAARGLALLGMLAVHFGPRGADGAMGAVYDLPLGRASILFALVAGIGMGLLSRRPEARLTVSVRLTLFAVLLLPLGLVLQGLDHNIAVILHHYAAFFLMGAIALHAGQPALLALGTVATVLGPAVYFAGRAGWPAGFGRNSVEFGQPPREIVEGLLFSGPYPLLTWAAPILVGLWLGRLPLARVRTQALMVLVGLGAALAAIGVSLGLTALFGAPVGMRDPRHLYSIAAHGQMPLWFVQAMGFGAAAVGVLLLVEHAFRPIVAPLVVLGQFALSAYVVHLLVLDAAPGLLVREQPLAAAGTVGLYGIAVIAFALLWGRNNRGPVESLLHLPWAVLGPHIGLARRPRDSDDVETARVRL